MSHWWVMCSVAILKQHLSLKWTCDSVRPVYLKRKRKSSSTPSSRSYDSTSWNPSVMTYPPGFGIWVRPARYALAANTARVCPWCSQEAVRWPCTAGMSTSRCCKIKICARVVSECTWKDANSEAATSHWTKTKCTLEALKEVVTSFSWEWASRRVLTDRSSAKAFHRIQIRYDSSSTNSGSCKKCRSEMCSVQCEKGEVSVEADYWHGPALMAQFLFPWQPRRIHWSNKGIEGWGRKHCPGPPQWQDVAACFPALTDSFSRLLS